MRKLDFETVKNITLGAARVESLGELIGFYRFTKREEELYRATRNDSYVKTFATSGVKLSFRTDSSQMLLKVVTGVATSRKYFSADVFVNGKLAGYLDNFGDRELLGNYVATDLPLGEFSKSFSLGEGEKTVTVHLPWSAKTAISELSVDDGAFIEAAKPPKRMLVYGDSITQGYDARRPSGRYASRLADALSAEEINKAIGGEYFMPALAECAEDLDPDYVTVAYGTNDWGKYSKSDFIDNCRGFYKTLSAKYPRAKIFAITPIWRKELEEKRAFGSFFDVDPTIRECVGDIDGVTVIGGFDLVPKEEKYFGDLRLHPNDEGFALYFEGLYSKIREILGV